MASVIRVTKEFGFEMAHVLWNYDGPCRNVHGHSYRLFVTLSGIPVREETNPRNGMLIDFKDLGNIVQEMIISRFDHSVVISRDFDSGKMGMMTKTFDNIFLVDYQPTCENLVADIAERIRNVWPEGVHLHSLRLYETATSYAEWFASDNDK